MRPVSASNQSKSLLTSTGAPAVSALEVLQPEPLEQRDGSLPPKPKISDESPIIQRETISLIPSPTKQSVSSPTGSAAAFNAPDNNELALLAHSDAPHGTDALDVISQLYVVEHRATAHDDQAQPAGASHNNDAADADGGGFFRFTEVVDPQPDAEDRATIHAELSTYLQNFKVNGPHALQPSQSHCIHTVIEQCLTNDDLVLFFLHPFFQLYLTSFQNPCLCRTGWPSWEQRPLTLPSIMKCWSRTSFPSTGGRTAACTAGWGREGSKVPSFAS